MTDSFYQVVLSGIIFIFTIQAKHSDCGVWGKFLHLPEFPLFSLAAIEEGVENLFRRNPWISLPVLSISPSHLQKCVKMASIAFMGLLS